MKFCRRLRLTEYFADKEREEDIKQKQLYFYSKKGRNKCYIENLSNCLFTQNKVNQNLTKCEKAELLNLRNDKSIAIKQADKDGKK